MKTGTVILLIILILFTAFATLGYFYSQFSVLNSENQKLRQQNKELTLALGELENIHKGDQRKIDELTYNVQILTDRLNEEVTARQYFANLSHACENRSMFWSDTDLQIFGAVATPALFGVLYAGMRLVRLPKNKKNIVTLKMTREQIKEYIRFQRGVGRGHGK